MLRSVGQVPPHSVVSCLKSRMKRRDAKKHSLRQGCGTSGGISRACQRPAKSYFVMIASKL